MRIISFLFFMILLSACVSFNANEGRYIGDASRDNGIALDVNDILFKTNHVYLADVNVTVFNGRVMLVGAVDTKRDLEIVVRKASQVEGVIEVINYVEIKGSESGEWGFDSYIQKKIVAQFIANKDVASNNYKVVVYRKIAYIIGLANSVNEEAKVLKIVRETSGVNDVRNNITIK